jgi:hypothetical protein
MRFFRTRCKPQSFVLGVCFLLSELAAAAAFEIIEGKGTAVCEAYQLAAQAWTRDMTCLGDNQFEGTDIARIGAPISEIRNGNDDRYPEYALMASAGDFITEHDVNPAAYYYTYQVGEWRATPEQLAIAQRELINRLNHHFPEGIQRTLDVDVNNDSKRDSVLFYPHCYTGSTATSLTMSAPLLLNEARTSVDVGRTLKLLREPIRHRFNPQPRRLEDGAWVADADFFSQSTYGFFDFKGSTYFDFRWDARPEQLPKSNDANVLRVYLAQGSSTRSVCAFLIASGHEK